MGSVNGSELRWAAHRLREHYAAVYGMALEKVQIRFFLHVDGEEDAEVYADGLPSWTVRK